MSAIVFAGCAGRTPPLAYQYLTTSFVIESLRNSPQTTAKVKAFQPLVCELVTGRVINAPDLADAMSGVTQNDLQAQSVANGILALYVGAVGDLSPTNTGAAWPYADAVFCAGISNGIVALEAPRTLKRSRNAPPEKALWPLVR